MTGTPDARTYPAPGSQVPGAPPPLKRALTPADGVPDAPRAASTTESAVAQRVSHRRPTRGGGSRLVAAAAMLGVAAGLELAGALSRRRR
jgi:hypothetical protein